MDFLKKNFMKIILSVILLTGAIFFLALLIQYRAEYHNELSHALLGETVTDSRNATSYLFGYIAGLVFFVTAMAFVIVLMFERTKNYGKWVLCGVGALGIILMSVSIVSALSSESSSLARDIMNGRHDAAIESVVEATARPQVTATVEANRAMIAAGVEAQAGDMIRAGVRAYMISQGAPAEIPVAEWPEPWLAAFDAAFEVEFAAAVDTTVASTIKTELAAAVAQNAPVQVALAQDTASYQYFSRVVVLVTKLILFGLLPLAWALKKIFEKNNKTA